MTPPTCLETGSSGLVGSEVCEYLSSRGCEIHGIDNNQPSTCYVSDRRKMKTHYPGWDVTKSPQQTLAEIVDTSNERISAR